MKQPTIEEGRGLIIVREVKPGWFAVDKITWPVGYELQCSRVHLCPSEADANRVAAALGRMLTLAWFSAQATAIVSRQMLEIFDARNWAPPGRADWPALVGLADLDLPSDPSDPE